MSHPQQHEYVGSIQKLFPNHFHKKSVLEVGSLNINGTVKDFFTDCFYIGIDIGPGPGVDIVANGKDWNAPEATFDTVISCECFEHNPYWVETFTNMHRMCKPMGLIVVTCATEGRKEHGTRRSDYGSSPLTIDLGWDYYKNLTAQDFEDNFKMQDLFSEYKFSTNDVSHDLYFWGKKRA